MLNRNPKLQKRIALFLILVFLNGTFSCYYYTYKTDSALTLEKIDKLKNSPNYIIVHQADQAFHLSRVTVNQDSQMLEGTLLILPPDHLKYLDTKPQPGSSNRYLKKGGKGKVNTPYVVNEVHIYIAGQSLDTDKQIAIPLTSIEKIEIYDPDTNATTASFVLGTILITVGVIAIVILIWLATKSSCPFVYVNNGAEYVFAGEIYSGAIFKSLERDDYLVLPIHQPEFIELYVSNQLKERQFINQINLLQVNHPIGTNVLPDRHGNMHLIKSLTSPAMAMVNDVENITTLLQEKDSMQFYFNSETATNYFNEVVLTFPKAGNSNEGHLVLTAKNSLWGDYVFGEFTKLFGKSYPEWIKKQGEKTNIEPGKWATEQGFAIKVEVEINGHWKYIDIADLVGPLAFRDLVVPIDLREHASDTVKVKLSAGFMLWDLDFAGLDFTPDEKLEILTIEPTSATTNKGDNTLAQLKEKDRARVEQLSIGDDVKIEFKNLAPTLAEQTSTFILHSCGYYEHVRDYTNPPEMAKLLTFKAPGRFSIFSKELLDEANYILTQTSISASTKSTK